MTIQLQGREKKAKRGGPRERTMLGETTNVSPNVNTGKGRTGLATLLSTKNASSSGTRNHEGRTRREFMM